MIDRWSKTVAMVRGGSFEMRSQIGPGAEQEVAVPIIVDRLSNGTLTRPVSCVCIRRGIRSWVVADAVAV